MTYYEFYKKAADEVIIQAENGLYYLEPSYRTILESQNILPDGVSDVKLSWNSVKEWLELEVKRRNTMDDQLPVVSKWLYNIITSTVEPAVLEEETDYVKAVTEYLQSKKETQTM